MDHLLLENPVTKSFDGGEAGTGMTLEERVLTVRTIFLVRSKSPLHVLSGS